MSEMLFKIDAAVRYLHSRDIKSADCAIILGSGLASYADYFKEEKTVYFGDIPFFMQPTNADHRSYLSYGEMNGKKIIVIAGRFHFYEGFHREDIVFPVRVMARLGVKRLIITNAAGAINTDYKAGEFMLISDHINLSARNPLIGENIPELGPRFPDMTDTYNKELRASVMAGAKEIGINLHEGVYTMVIGPSFETPAEIRFMRIIGADAVGMSSVPEAIAAKHAGMEVIGISCLTNMAAGILDQPITGEEVNATADANFLTFCELLNIAINV